MTTIATTIVDRTHASPAVQQEFSTNLIKKIKDCAAKFFLSIKNLFNHLNFFSKKIEKPVQRLEDNKLFSKEETHLLLIDFIQEKVKEYITQNPDKATEEDITVYIQDEKTVNLFKEEFCQKLLSAPDAAKARLVELKAQQVVKVEPTPLSTAQKAGVFGLGLASVIGTIVASIYMSSIITENVPNFLVESSVTNPLGLIITAAAVAYRGCQLYNEWKPVVKSLEKEKDPVKMSLQLTGPLTSSCFTVPRMVSYVVNPAVAIGTEAALKVTAWGADKFKKTVIACASEESKPQVANTYMAGQVAASAALLGVQAVSSTYSAAKSLIGGVFSGFGYLKNAYSAAINFTPCPDLTSLGRT